MNNQAVIGAVLNSRFRVLRRLGSGGQGAAWLVQDLLLGETHRVLKEVPRADQHHIEGELRLLADLRHPNLLTPLGALRGVEDDRLRLVLEYCPGGDLTAWATTEPSVAARLRAMREVMRGLAFLHERGVVHRDLKPGNVLVDSLGRMRIADFGLSVHAAADTPDAEVAGTPRFLAPELLTGRQGDTRAADLFSAGVLLFWLLSGRLPFPATRPRDFVAQVERGVQWPGETASALGSALLAPRPERRGTAQAAAEQLARALDDGVGWETAAGLRARLNVSGAHGRGDLPAEIVRQAMDSDGDLGVVVWLVAGSGEGKSGLLEACRTAAGLRGALTPAAQPPEGVATRLDAWLGVEPAAGDDNAAAARSLWTLAERRPVLLCLDDLERAEPAAEELLGVLLRTRAEHPGARLGIVLTTGPAGWDQRAELREAWRPFARVARREVPPLDRAAIDALCSRVSPGHPVPEGFASDLSRQTRGHPALVVETLARLVADGRAPRVSGAPLPSRLTADEVGVPESLSDLAAQWTAAASPAELRQAWLIAHLGGRCQVDAYERLHGAGGLELSTATPTGLVERVSGPAGSALRVRAHAVEARLRERPLTDSERTMLSAVADRLRTEGGASQRVVADLLARLGRFVDAAALAVDGARWSDAARWLTEARTRGNTDPRVDVDLAVALTTLGHADEARAALARLDDTYRRQPELAARLLGIELQAGRPRGALQLWETLGRLPGAPLLASLRARAHLLLGDYDQALATLDATPAPTGDRAAAVHRGITRASVALYRGDYVQARDLAQRLADDPATQEAAPGELPMLLNLVAIVAQRQGEVDDARRYYQRSLEVAQTQGNHARVGIALMNLGTLAQGAGDLAEALARYRDAESIARRGGDDVALVKALLNVANLRLQTGEVPEARLAVERAGRVGANVSSPFLSAYVELLNAEVHLRLDRHEEAQRLAASARSRFEQLGAAREAADSLLVLARSWVESRRLRAAGGAIDRLIEASEALDAVRLRLWALWLGLRAGRLGTGAPPPTTVDEAARSLATTDESVNPEDRWRLHLELAWAFDGVERRADAASHAREAGRLLEELEARVGPDARAAFLGQAEVRAARAVVRALGGAGAGGPAVEETGVFVSQLLGLNKRLAVETDTERILETILDVAVAMTEAERGFVVTPAPGAEALGGAVVRVARNFDQESLDLGHLRYSSSIASEVFLTGRSLVTFDAMGDDRFAENRSVHAMRLRSVMCVPMRHRGVPIGVVYIDNRFARGAFDERKQRFMEAFADQAAIALARAEALRREREGRESLEVANAELAAARAEVERLNRRLSRQLARRSSDLEQARAELDEQRSQLETRYRYDRIIGASPAMERVFDRLDRIARTSIPVLITGESGTGKELVARALHHNGPRAERRLVAINCAALPETLLESEIFGVVRGAFTGADRDRQGLFEQADGGTLFLDELGEMTLGMQVKLLRVLDSGQLRRVGGDGTRTVDVRVVAATNRDLEVEVAAGRFREDLFYRLNVLRVSLPPLRERPEDLPMLVDHFLAQVGEQGVGKKTLSRDALQRLRAHDWPGNVRELQSVITAAALLSESPRIQLEDLPPLHSSSAPASVYAWDGRSTLETIQVRVIRDALEQMGGNKSRTARALGVDRNTLRAKLRREPPSPP